MYYCHFVFFNIEGKQIFYVELWRWIGGPKIKDSFLETKDSFLETKDAFCTLLHAPKMPFVNLVFGLVFGTALAVSKSSPKSFLETKWAGPSDKTEKYLDIF